MTDQAAVWRRLMNANLAKADQVDDDEAQRYLLEAFGYRQKLDSLERPQAPRRPAPGLLLKSDAPRRPAPVKPAVRPAPTLSKADAARLDSLVAAEMAKSQAPLLADLAATQRVVDGYLAAHAPGAPLVRQTARPSREAEAAALRRKADDLAREDPTAARGYRDMAAQLLRRS